MFRSSNPAFNPKVFENARSFGMGQSMTIQGTVNKTFISLFLLVVSASWIWAKVMQPVQSYNGYHEGVATASPNIGGFLILGFVGSIIAWLVTMFKKEWSGYSVPVYALFEGILIGSISAMFEARYPGIVIQAVGLTFGTMFCLLMLYKTGVIKVTQKFRMGVSAAVGAIFLVYMVSWIMSMFGTSIPLIHGNGLVGIGFSLVVITIAALTLVLDFDFIDRASTMGLPKYMEWYAAFGLMVSLIWLYLEFLRLLSKLNRR